MAKSELSDSEEESENENCSTPKNEGKVPEYELQRLKRIEENKKRMEALGLQKMATSFNASVEKSYKKKTEKKGKKKIVEEDEEYNPIEDDEEMSSSSEEDNKNKNDEDFSGSQKKKVKKNTTTPKKRGPSRKLMFDSDYVDDDDALMQAIALSLGFLDEKTSSPSQISGAHLKNISTSGTPGTNIIDKSIDNKRESPLIHDDSLKRKRKKSISSRVQMSEDEMLMHFFEFDETGKGVLTLRDVERLAVVHDFIWSEKEMADMIYCFDSDGDGKISLDDFRKIVGRCGMLKAPGI
ncbi:hypothetical protein ACJIZ3_007845 [Penstemon smallii]|uniref:EF-hand domain-containing protein n=1 Tax=Penstemon smallii TaxID=265156 RepID=A0ABD3T837_9LAMI